MRLSVVFLATWSCMASAVSSASAPFTFGKGYVRRSRKQLLGVEKLSQDVRDSAPDAMDWVAKGAVTPVKNQGACGDCWAFSTAEGIESAVYMATGSLVGLSEQQLTSCDQEMHGCGGGDPGYALEYVKKSGGIASQADYPDASPQSGITGNCSWDGSKAAIVTGSRYAVPACEDGSCDNQDEEGLAAAVAKYGPLSICINADPWNNTLGWTIDHVWQPENCSHGANDLDHCVQLVGYDKTAPVPYWKIKNSWTAEWGEGGYLRIPYGKNTCGVANEAYIIEATAAGSSPIIV